MLHILTHGAMRNAKVWVDFFGGLRLWQDSWYKGEKCDNKEWDSTNIHSLGF